MTAAVPDQLYWEDFKPGEVIELGRHTFTEAQIIAFGREYDPQPFHIDPEAARQTYYGGLIASGWHTCAVGMRLMVETFIGRAASAGSPGVDNIRWLGPVRSGDTITYRRTIMEVRPSASRPDIGLVRSLSEALNQRGEMVMTMEGWGLFRRRPKG
jgi:acyl dehydratase